MEFLTPQKKKERSRRLYTGYALFGILISLATYIMVSTALGYEIFSTKGEVIQNGLLFIDSRPNDAEIYVNNVKESTNSNAKLSLPENSYSITLRKNGYREWTRTTNVLGGKVTFLTYPRLLPVAPTTVQSTGYSAIPSMLQSRDKKWLAMFPALSPNTVQLHNLENPNDPINTLPIPTASTEGLSVTSLEFLEWAGDNIHFMVRITLENSVQKVVSLNREKPQESVDITQLFGTPASSIHNYWDGKWDKIAFLDSQKMLRVAEIKEKAVSATPLVSESISEVFVLGNESAVFTVKNGDNHDIKYYKNNKIYLITTYLPNGNPLHVVAAGFNRNDYLAIAGGNLEKTLVFRNVIDGIEKSDTGRAIPQVLLPLKSSNIEFSRSNRFLYATDGNDAMVYDFEQKELVRYTLPMIKPLTTGWLDDSRLYVIDATKKLSVMDFDGNNVYEIASNVVSIPYVDNNIEFAGYVTQAENATPVLTFIDIQSESE